MRVKTLLVFSLLITGIAISQQGGSKSPLGLNDILRLVDFSDVKSANRMILSLGYESTADGDFSNGYNKFRLVPGKFGLVYSEDYTRVSRSEDIQRAAIKAGFELLKDTPRQVLMKSEAYDMEITVNKVTIQRSRKK